MIVGEIEVWAWAGYGDWLGTGNVSYKEVKWRSFQEAPNFARKLKLNSQSEWKVYAGSGKLPSNIPKELDHLYKGKGWCGYVDWLGTVKKRKSKKMNFTPTS